MARNYLFATRGHILVFLLIIIGLVVVGMLIFTKDQSHHALDLAEKHAEISGQRDIFIANQTQLPQNILFEDGRAETLAPGARTTARLPLGAKVYAHAQHYDASRMENTASLDNPIIRELHLTPDGFKSEINVSKDVVLQNASDLPVIFVHRSTRGGRRWPSPLVLPGGELVQSVLPVGSTWEVVDTNNERAPLDSLSVGGKIGVLRYDGVRLTTHKKVRFNMAC